MTDATATSTESAASVLQGGFVSLGDIRAAHLELMRQASDHEALDHSARTLPDPTSESMLPSHDAIRAFLDSAKQAGRVIERESDRRAAQRILDYWSVELVARPSITKSDMSPARLAPFEGDGTTGLETVAATPSDLPSDMPPTASAAPADMPLTEEEEVERSRIRVGAQARQWETTKYDGYLLRGDALVEATKLPPGPDIDAFIQASIAAEEKRRGQTKNTWIGGFVALSVVLALAAWFAFVQAKEAERKADEISVLNTDLNKQVAATKAALADVQQKADEITKLNDQLRSQFQMKVTALEAAETAREEAQRARLQAEDALAAANQKAGDAAKRERKLDETQALFEAAIRVISDGLKQGQIRLEDVSERLRGQALVQITGDVKNGAIQLDALPSALQAAVRPLVSDEPNTLPDNLSGYRPNFLDAVIRLPTLTGKRATDTLEGPINYVNYSLVMSRSHRMAFYGAVNLDRSRRLYLQTTGEHLRYDVRIATAAQPDPKWYYSTWVPAQLASSADIAWGPTFAGDPDAAALKLSAYASLLPNSMPMPPALATGVWAQLENWTRNEHNPLANKVTIFTGPVFGPATEGQPTGAMPVPTAYWKVAVSSVLTAEKGEIHDPEYRVDAFLVPADTTETKFDPSTFRISISELERRTGIDFGYLIEWTDSVNHPGPGGRTIADDLAGRLDMLNSPQDGERKLILDELQGVLGSPDLPVSELRKVVAALTDMASTVNMLPLTRDGRLNVLQSLIWVPEQLWRRPDWLPLWAEARVAAGDLEVRSDNDETNIGQRTRELLDQLKENLGIQPSVQKVFLQFAGMTRDAAKSISARMRAVGWAIPQPGEERTGKAAGLNEVRYNPDSSDDRTAAERLAADLTAAGQAAKTKPVSAIKEKTLEIWISK